MADGIHVDVDPLRRGQLGDGEHAPGIGLERGVGVAVVVVEGGEDRGRERRSGVGVQAHAAVVVLVAVVGFGDRRQRGQREQRARAVIVVVGLEIKERVGVSGAGDGLQIGKAQHRAIVLDLPEHAQARRHRVARHVGKSQLRAVVHVQIRSVQLSVAGNSDHATPRHVKGPAVRQGKRAAKSPITGYI